MLRPPSVRPSRRVPTRNHSSSEYSSGSPPLLRRSRSPTPDAIYPPPSRTNANAPHSHYDSSRQNIYPNDEYSNPYYQYDNYNHQSNYHSNRQYYSPPAPQESQHNTQSESSSYDDHPEPMSPPRQQTARSPSPQQTNRRSRYEVSDDPRDCTSNGNYLHGRANPMSRSPQYQNYQSPWKQTPYNHQNTADKRTRGYHTSPPASSPYRDRVGDEEGAPTQSDSDDVGDPLQVDHAEETEDESDQSPQHSPRDPWHSPQPPPRPNRKQHHQTSRYTTEQHAQDRSTSRTRTVSVWSQYHPVVHRASEICSAANVDPYAISYARLLSTGKAAVDFYVRTRSVIIGRAGSDADCQLKSESQTVSRRHAKLYWDPSYKRWMLTCLSAKNGMVVDGAPIVPFGIPVPLKSQALIEIGDVSFSFLAPAGNSFCVNDIQFLQQQISEARIAETQREQISNVDDNEYAEDHAEIEPSNRAGPKQDPQSIRKMKPADNKAAKVLSKKSSKIPLQSTEHETTSEEVSDSEDEKLVVPDILDLPKYNLPVVDIASRKKKKGSERGGSRKRRRRERNYEEDESELDSASHVDDWNKKEKTDFMRALFAVGVDAVTDEDGNVTGFDWTRFRRIAYFPKKSDEMLEEHFRRVMADARALLEEEEKEKKLKGARNTHRPDCECSVCENVRKSGKRRREDERGRDDDARMKGKGRLMGLVTAQKLRVRLGMLEALLSLDTSMADDVFKKLEKNQPKSGVKDLPEWWEPGIHDRDLMRGCLLHGIGQWNDIWQDDSLSHFVTELQRYDSDEVEMKWPTNQVAMKRVRELASLIQSEMRKVAKRSAQVEKDRRRDARRKAKKIARKQAREHVGGEVAGPYSDDYWDTNQNESSSRNVRNGKNIVARDAYGVEVEDGESTEDESSSRDVEGESGMNNPDGAETEDEDDVEIEVDEMDTEDEDEDDFNESGGYNGHQGVQRHDHSSGEWGPSGAHYQNTDDRDIADKDGDDGFETASESDSE